MERFDDLTVLDIAEGYRMNSRKGLRYLQWIDRHVSAMFLLKVRKELLNDFF
jgi:hypothetical protein